MPSDNPVPSRRRPRDEPARAAPRRISAAEALRIEPRSIEVADGKSLELSADDPAHAASFARVHIARVEELQALGLIPRSLPEDKLREAIAADDAEALRMASAMASSGTRHAGCDCDTTPTGANPVRSALARIRARHNPNLAQLLSAHFGRKVGFDAPIGAMLRKWTERLVATHAGIDIEVLHLRDIKIGRGATLTVPASTQSLAARHIYIESTGTMRLQGGYTKIWATSITPFRLKLDAALLAKNNTMQPIWLAG